MLSENSRPPVLIITKCWLACSSYGFSLKPCVCPVEILISVLIPYLQQNIHVSFSLVSFPFMDTYLQLLN